MYILKVSPGETLQYGTWPYLWTSEKTTTKPRICMPTDPWWNLEIHPQGKGIVSLLSAWGKGLWQCYPKNTVVSSDSCSHSSRQLQLQRYLQPWQTKTSQHWKMFQMVWAKMLFAEFPRFCSGDCRSRLRSLRSKTCLKHFWYINFG